MTRMLLCMCGIFLCVVTMHPVLAQQSPRINWISLGGPYGAGRVHDIVVDGTSGDVFAATDTGVYRYGNGSWVHLPAPVTWVNSLLSWQGNMLFAGTHSSGLCKSTNAGQDWSLVNSFPNLQIGALFRDDAGSIYAGSDDVYKSTDEGETWISLDACPRTDVRFHGLNFGPYLNGANPEIGDTVSSHEVRRLLTTIAPYTEWVRTFGCGGGLHHVGSLASDLGMKTAIGAWLCGDDTADTREIDSLVAIANRGEADMVIVGSETLYRGQLTAEELIAWLDEVRTRIRDTTVLITTADTYHALLAHPQLFPVVDVVMANFYPFWEQVPIDDAVDTLIAAYNRLSTMTGGKEVIVSETGWPTCGNAYGNAIPSLTNARQYWLGVQNWSRSERVPVFVFEAFDEAWKAHMTGGHSHDSCWGIWDAHLNLKNGMESLFPQSKVGSTQSTDSPCGGPGFPAVHLTHVPAYGSYSELTGRVWHVDHNRYEIAVYLFVSDSWWTKPYRDTPTTSINNDCTFSCNVTTGGIDEIATKYVVFLIDAAFQPDILLGADGIPPRMWNNAVAWTEYEREPCGAFKALHVRPSGMLLAGSSGAGIFTTTNMGETWTRPGPPPPSDWFVSSIVSCDQTSEIFSGGQPDVYVSTDGTNWSQCPSPVGSSINITDLITPSDTLLVAATERGVHLMQVAGQGWTSGGLDTSTCSLAYDGSGHLYAGTAQHGVYRSVKIQNATTPPSVGTDVDLHPAFPNPSHGNVHFILRMERPSFVRVTIHDILGRELDVLYEGTLRECVRHLTWDAAAWPTGQYMCRITTNRGSRQQHVIVIH